MASGDKYLKTMLKPISVEYLLSLIGDRVDGDVIISFKADVYDVIDAWGITGAGSQHGIKKLMMPGERHNKSKLQDLRESIDAVQRDVDREELIEKFNNQMEK